MPTGVGVGKDDRACRFAARMTARLLEKFRPGREGGVAFMIARPVAWDRALPGLLRGGCCWERE